MGASSNRGEDGGNSKSLSPRFRINSIDFTHIDATSFKCPYAIDINFDDEVDYEALNRYYSNFEEDLEEKEDI